MSAKWNPCLEKPSDAEEAQSAATHRRMTDRKTDILETDRLTLRVFELSDLEPYAAIETHPEVLRYLSHGPRSKDRIRISLAWFIQLQERHGFSVWAADLRKTGELVGYCGLLPQPIDGRTEIEVACLFGRDHWNIGLATEAVCEVRDWAFAHLNPQRVMAMIDPLNVAAIRVAEKAAMRYAQNVEYAGKDCRLYAVTRPPL